ncbi:heavy metal-associated isoprenylated plant protein 47-like [Syzygium oleosum]|uniref:heavy metal-associated isoprenylated plant protein 47-like n=1 Tax=Syzygium oleosum TaxID=219896 RepID=UPI0024B8D18B|nr:heavy metal-associated isoprenylated plant protein 47-like [Syzygium oleosum]
MKQKVVIKIFMNDSTSRFNCFKPQSSHSKALKVAAGFSGVQSVALVGDDKDLIEVVGDGVDAAKLATLLRKKVEFTEIVSVSEVGEKDKKESESKDKPSETTTTETITWFYNGRSPHYEIVCVPHYKETWGWPL